MLAETIVGRANGRGVHAQVELRQIEAERAGARTKIGQATVRDALAAVGSEQRVEIVQIREQLVSARVAVGAEPLPDLDEHGAERLVVVPALGDRADHRRRHPPRRAECPQLTAVQLACELPGALESILDRLGPDVGIAVEVSADPGSEPQRLAG